MIEGDNERKVQNLVNELFNSAKVDRTFFILRNKQTIPKSMEHFIAPMRLSKQELAMESGLAEIASSDFNIHAIENIPLFPQSFESDLILKPPKIVDYHHVVQTSKIIQPIVKPIVKGIREKKVRGPRVMKRPLQANILPDFAASVDDNHNAKKFRGEIEEGDYDPVLLYDCHNILKYTSAKFDSIFFHSYILAFLLSSQYFHHLCLEEDCVGMDELRAPPENLYKVIGGVFDEFWNMDYPENVVNAFLARIDKRNCADYGLPDFASESCSLPVIQVSLVFYSTLNFPTFN